jgi:hypothetical protein
MKSTGHEPTYTWSEMQKQIALAVKHDRQQRTWVELTDEQTNKAAMKLAERLDYPWTHMPEEGKREMRNHVKAVIEAFQGIKE